MTDSQRLKVRSKCCTVNNKMSGFPLNCSTQTSTGGDTPNVTAAFETGANETFVVLRVGEN